MLYDTNVFTTQMIFNIREFENHHIDQEKIRKENLKYSQNITNKKESIK